MRFTIYLLHLCCPGIPATVSASACTATRSRTADKAGQKWASLFPAPYSPPCCWHRAGPPGRLVPWRSFPLIPPRGLQTNGFTLFYANPVPAFRKNICLLKTIIYIVLLISWESPLPFPGYTPDFGKTRATHCSTSTCLTVYSLHTPLFTD